MRQRIIFILTANTKNKMSDKDKKSKLELLLAQIPVDKYIPLDSIRVHPQMRKTFDPEKIQKLANNIRRIKRLLNPVIVNHKNERQTYDLIAGERRFRAYNILRDKYGKEYSKIRANIYSNLGISQVCAIQFSENSYEPVNAAESAIAYAHLYKLLKKEHQLIEGKPLTIKDFGDIIGKSDSVVSDALKFVTLPSDVQKLAKQRVLPYKVAVEICRINEQDSRRGLIYSALAHKWDEKRARERVNQIIADRSQENLPGFEITTEEQAKSIVDMLTKPVHQNGVAGAYFLQRVLELAKENPNMKLLRNKSIIQMAERLGLVGLAISEYGRKKGAIDDKYKGPIIKTFADGTYD